MPATTRIPEFTRIPENRATTIFSGVRVGICNLFFTSLILGFDKRQWNRIELVSNSIPTYNLAVGSTLDSTADSHPPSTCHATLRLATTGQPLLQLQVWSLTQFYCISFLQSNIIVQIYFVVVLT